MYKLLTILVTLCTIAATAQKNPNVLPESSYPYWPSYNHLDVQDLDTIEAQKWIQKEHVIAGWDWSLPEFVEPAPRSSVGLQRIMGVDTDYSPINLKFKANPVGLLWVKWRDIEPTPGNYNFEPVIKRIKQAQAVGSKISLRILGHSKARGASANALNNGEAPLWLEDLGATLLERKNTKDNLNFNPAHPVFHKRYLMLINELAKTEIPKMVKAAYVGYASHSFGDEGIGPYGEGNSAANDTAKHVRERLDAWEKAFKGMENKVFMGGSCDYGFNKGFGVRRGFVEMYLYNIPNSDLGQFIDQNGYLCIDETSPIMKHRCFNGEVNEEYENAWATPERGFRFGNSTNSYPYRYFTSTLRALQMQCTYIHTTGHLIPKMLPFLSLELARTEKDAPDVWTFLRTSYLKAGNYKNNDWKNRLITEKEKTEGIETKNFERWLYQRDAVGYETQPAVKIEQAIKMWMVQENKYYDYIARAGKKIGFDIDDRWVGAKDSMAIKVTYFDYHAGTLNLVYNNGTKQVVKKQKLMGDGNLRTVTFIVAHVKANSMKNNFDFTLEAGANTDKIVISMVRAIQLQKTQDWGGITVKVNADNSVASSQKLTVEKSGLRRLTITLTNKGNQIASIDSIEIRIPIAEAIAPENKIAYGSSSMGSRPVLIHKVAEPQSASQSYMYAMIQQANNQYLFAGSLSWRIFIPIITLENNAFVVRSKGEGKQLKPGQSIQYEQIVLSRSSDWQDMLDTFGSSIAKENGLKKLKEVNYKGWATWDYYAYKFSDIDIYENLELVKQLDPASNLVQIDAGWYTQRGDFANSRTDLPGGMKAIADRIKAAGMTPGIWIDGFRANTDSEVFKKHPEYFLHDNEGNVIVQLRRPAGPDKDRVYIDYSHPGARAHMANSIRVITREFGIPYIKIDFILLGLNNEILKANPKFKSIKPYDSSMSDVERVRMGLQTIRREAGPESFLLGCSAVFGPCLGFVDGMRTGGDINPRFEAFSERVLANAGNSYLNGKVFRGDADYLVFREAADEDAGVSQEHVKHGGSLTLNEAQMWADFNKLYGNFRLSSDKILTLRPERRDMIKDVFDFPAMDETVPLDFWQHGKNKTDGYELIIARHGKDIYLGIFNWSDSLKEYNLSAFGVGVQKVKARHSKVLKYTGKLSFAELRKALASQETDLSSKWDTIRPLANPDKGWYQHLLDNGIHKYAISNESTFKSFPGMDHLYLRLAWAFLEPEEGKYDWSYIDNVIEKYVPLGYQISFRISCKETGKVGESHPEEINGIGYATPYWVVKAGAKGIDRPEFGPAVWTPDWNDPVYLEKLDNFHKAFAARYDGKPWVRYIDVGSIGDWGEGHTWKSTRIKPTFAEVKTHIDLHVKHYKKTLIVVTDDMLRATGSDSEKMELYNYAVAKGISLRDDSPMVLGLMENELKTWTVKHPYFFEGVYKSRPTVFELEHYGKVKTQGHWFGKNGKDTIPELKVTGADVFRNSIKIIRPTYIGFHGYLEEWIADNPDLTVELLNLCGYWYFPKSISKPQINNGELSFEMEWLNKGVAPAYTAYELRGKLIPLAKNGQVIDFVIEDSGNMSWMPGELSITKYNTQLSKKPKGEYSLAIQLFDKKSQRPVDIGLKNTLKQDNFFILQTINI